MRQSNMLPQVFNVGVLKPPVFNLEGALGK